MHGISAHHLEAWTWTGRLLELLRSIPVREKYNEGPEVRLKAEIVNIAAHSRSRNFLFPVPFYKSPQIPVKTQVLLLLRLGSHSFGT